MKNLSFLLLAVLMLSYAFAQDAKPRFTTKSPLIDKYKDLITAYENKDWDTWENAYTSDAKIFHNNWTKWASPQEFVKSQKEFLTTLSSYKFQDEPVFYEQIIDDEGKTWIYFWGTWEAMLKNSDQPIRIPVHLAMQFDGERITEEYGFYDMTPYYEATGVISNPSNLSLIQNIYKDFSVGNMEGVTSAMAEDIVWNEAENFPYADGNPYEGSDAIVEGVFARLGGEWEGWSLNDLEFHPVADNMVLVTGRYNARYKENGKMLDSQMAHLWTLENGKAIAFQQYTDTKKIHDVMKQ